MDKMISVSNLSKKYGDVKAIDDISFTVDKGELFCLLGLNGAGKSTTINILCTILEQDGGVVNINGYDLEKESIGIKNSIGIVFQGSVLDAKLSVKDNLTTRASYYGINGSKLKARLEELTELLQLEDLLKRRYGKLSGGQKRRVDIARALINKPKVLFLDEPTTGLDPQTRQVVWKVINQLRSQLGLTVLLTTHYMEETADSDMVVIMDNGKIVAQGTPNYLKESYTYNYIKLHKAESEANNKELTALGLDYSYNHTHYKIRVKQSHEALAIITANKDFFDDFEIAKGDMDDVFLTVTGKILEG